MRPPIYHIGQEVFHITPDSPKGVVLDCCYSVRNGSWTYIVTFTPLEGETSYYEDELVLNKKY